MERRALGPCACREGGVQGFIPKRSIAQAVVYVVSVNAQNPSSKQEAPCGCPGRDAADGSLAC